MQLAIQLGRIDQRALHAHTPMFVVVYNIVVQNPSHFMPHLSARMHLSANYIHIIRTVSHPDTETNVLLSSVTFSVVNTHCFRVEWRDQ